eukprot:scaffold10490_cov90-Skeletonema_dohrnii-CCMP3373.AAC.1
MSSDPPPAAAAPPAAALPQRIHVPMMPGLVTLRRMAAVAGTCSTCGGTCHDGCSIVMVTMTGHTSS